METQTGTGPQKKVGKYILCLDDKLGEGVFGMVYKGYEINNPSNQVAIKQVNINVSEQDLKALKKLLETEVMVMMSLSHENIIKFEDVSITSNNIYIITELCNGGDLDHIKKDLTIEQTLICIKQIVTGMLYANSQKVIHRDLKPANILVHDGIIKTNYKTSRLKKLV